MKAASALRSIAPPPPWLLPPPPEAGAVGVALASRTIAAMVYTSGALIVLAVGLVVVRGRSGLKATIPFGPLLALGALIAYFTQ